MVFETMVADQQILQIEDFTAYSKSKKEEPVGLPRNTSFRRPCFQSNGNNLLTPDIFVQKKNVIPYLI